MSQHLYFYVRNENTFLPIDNFSRNHYLYKVCSDWVPYDHIKALSKDMLLSIAENIRTDIATMKSYRDEHKNNKEFIKHCDNSLEEKLIKVAEINTAIEECNDSLREMTYALYFITFLTSMCEHAYDTQWDESNLQLDSDTYIYAGIEMSHPTMEDVEI